MPFFSLVNIFLGLASMILVVISIIGAATEPTWSPGKRVLWGILSLVLGLIGSGIAFWLRGRKTTSMVCFALLIISIIITILTFTRSGGALQPL